ncbi:peroxiredoxin [Thalassospira lucentensis]|uniref:peroxiredoxin n=1 Tax=Thalassospira lucentensis TaxID=168935 RepID=UPI00294235C9|nr:peroxiredoxin [Thalassospira lucentensis]WOI10124.1 peroxiredoxin [Thalassospira lucentensis]
MSSESDAHIVERLTGQILPSFALAATNDQPVDLATLSGRTVVYAYPRTAEPEKPSPAGWDEIPGAKGCTPQSCSFRDHAKELSAVGVDHLFGLSSQTTDYQKEAAERLHLPFALLSDADHRFKESMAMPDFVADDMRLFKRLTMIIDDGRISKVFYPVDAPAEDAENVLRWCRDNTRG